MKNILLILFASFLLSTISVAQTGTVTQSSSTVEERYGDRIELMGIKFKGPLVLCQVLIAIMMTIAFIQSGVDKIIDRSGNLAFFNEHFSNTPLKSFTSFFLSILNILSLNCQKYKNQLKPNQNLPGPGRLGLRTKKWGCVEPFVLRVRWP